MFLVEFALYLFDNAYALRHFIAYVLYMVTPIDFNYQLSLPEIVYD